MSVEQAIKDGIEAINERDARIAELEAENERLRSELRVYNSDCQYPGCYCTTICDEVATEVLFRTGVVKALEWEDCSCGKCGRSYPVNFGTFYEGSGFDPIERALMDRAFAALEPAAPEGQQEPVAATFGWECNNCTTIFTSAQEHRRAGDNNGGPPCPHCKAFGQFTYRYELHSGDPCVKCGASHDDVPAGPCVPRPSEPAAPEGQQEPVTTVYEPYPDAFDGILGPDTRPSEQEVTEAMVEAACRAWINAPSPLEVAMRAALKAAMEEK